MKREVHVFSDASESAFCAAAYPQTVPQDGECTITLITS